MKKFIASAVSTLFMIAMLSGAKADLYPAAGVIIDIDHVNNTVAIEMPDGNVYTAYGCEDYWWGDYVALIMNDMDTNTIYDDEIVMMRYVGYQAMFDAIVESIDPDFLY